MKGLDFKVEQSIFDDLLAFREKLPRIASGANRADSEDDQSNYDHPAGLCLLGEEKGLVDTIMPLKMSGGCWDAPNINYDDMDKGFRALLKTGRRCVGMAFIRNPRWGAGWDAPQYEAKLSQTLRYQIHGMRHSFADISKTVWIVVHKDNFRFYKPSVDKEKRVSIKEIIAEKKIETHGKALHPFVKAKIEKAKKVKAARAARKKERALLVKEQAEAIAKERKKN